MTGTELKTFVESLVSDSPSDTWFYETANAVKDEIEGERNWEFLKKLDASKTHPAGGTSTLTYALPTDFGMPIKTTIGSDTGQRNLISLGDSRVLSGESGCWFIDWIGSTFSFTGTESVGGTVYMLYSRFTPDIDSSSSPTWPERFHKVIGYETAKRWYAYNAGEKEFDWSGEHADAARSLKASMILWDERLKAKALNSAGTPADASNAYQIS